MLSYLKTVKILWAISFTGFWAMWCRAIVSCSTTNSDNSMWDPLYAPMLRTVLSRLFLLLSLWDSKYYESDLNVSKTLR